MVDIITTSWKQGGMRVHVPTPCAWLSSPRELKLRRILRLRSMNFQDNVHSFLRIADQLTAFSEKAGRAYVVQPDSFTAGVLEAYLRTVGNISSAYYFSTQELLLICRAMDVNIIACKREGAEHKIGIQSSSCLERGCPGRSAHTFREVVRRGHADPRSRPRCG